MCCGVSVGVTDYYGGPFLIPIQGAITLFHLIRRASFVHRPIRETLICQQMVKLVTQIHKKIAKLFFREMFRDIFSRISNVPIRIEIQIFARC